MLFICNIYVDNSQFKACLKRIVRIYDIYIYNIICTLYGRTAMYFCAFKLKEKLPKYYS